MLSWADDKAVSLVEKMRRGSPRSTRPSTLGGTACSGRSLRLTSFVRSSQLGVTCLIDRYKLVPVDSQLRVVPYARPLALIPVASAGELRIASHSRPLAP